MSDDPTTYGIWNRETAGWMQDDSGVIMEFVSRHAAVAQAHRIDLMGLGDLQVCIFGPGGSPRTPD